MCGGCSLQHLAPAAQRAHKRARLATLLEEAGLAPPGRWLEDLVGPSSGYRRKARLGVRHVPALGGSLVGFRVRGSGRVVDSELCLNLVPQVGLQLAALRRLVASLSIPQSVPQIEIAAGDDDVAIVLRHLAPLTEADVARLVAFSERFGWAVWLQPGGPETVERLAPTQGSGRLHYRLDAFGLRLAFHPTDFTQVNGEINRQLVSRAVELLAPTASDAVLDLFCGLGNFTLPLATRSGEVLGVEGSETLVERARENAAANGIGSARFETRDLYADDFDVTSLPSADLLLIDPPRSGAGRIADGIGAGSSLSPRRVVYVSCNPVSLAEDLAVMTRRGYALSAIGIVDMFPNTSHVESIALLEARD